MWQQRTIPGPVYFGVVDLGATTLRLLVIEAGPGGAKVWGWAEVPGFGTSQPTAADLADVCREGLSEAEGMAQDLSQRWILPDRLVVGLPASQLIGRAWPITQQRSRPEGPVEERELEALLARGLRLAINRLQAIAADSGPWLLVDAAAVALSVDGRGVTDPVGFRGQELGTSVFASLAAAEVVANWRAVAETLDFAELILATTPLALAAGPPAAQGLLVDVGGEFTHLTWFRGARPRRLASLPAGGGDVTRSLLRKWPISLDRAEQLKRAYAGGQLADDARTQVQEVLLPVVGSWLNQMEAAMEQMNEEEALPQKIYLMGGASHLPEIAESMRALAWSQRLQFERYPEMRTFRPTDVPGVVNRTELGRNRGSVAALALAAWTARQQQAIDRPTRILTRLCQE
jgi:cell division ATPase FtsA